METIPTDLLGMENITNRELLDLRFMIEIGAAEMVIDAASDEEIARLEAANEKLKEAARKDS